MAEGNWDLNYKIGFNKDKEDGELGPGFKKSHQSITDGNNQLFKPKSYDIDEYDLDSECNGSDNDDDENDFDEDNTALSQLVAQVEESFDTSSSEEDEEVDNAGNESNHDFPLSNSSSHSFMLNEDDQSIASLWIENAPTEVKNSFPNWKQDITYVFKQSIQSLRTACENMSLKKSEIEKE